MESIYVAGYGLVHIEEAEWQRLFQMPITPEQAIDFGFATIEDGFLRLDDPGD